MRLRQLLITLLIVGGALLCAHTAMRHAERLGLADEAARLHQPLSVYANSLNTLIERYRALPAVLALDPQLVAALAAPLTTATQAALNRKLERINDAARSSTLQLLDREGQAVAASNWREDTSYVGHNYAFRPYFQQPLAHGSGSFYAVGVTSGVPGYFLSSAVNDAAGRFLGALVVKLELPQLEQQWRQGEDLLLVSDARGIVFIANRPGWRYRALRELNLADLEQLSITRQYDKQPLTPLAYQRLRPFGDNSHLVEVQTLDGPQRYLWESLALQDNGWTLHLLRTPTLAQDDALYAGLAAAGLWLTLMFLALFLNQRWRLARVRRRSREELEQLVEARTRDLRTAQDGLVQAAKLAALGQMSAALAHEINQPLTAQRMHLASLRLLLGQGRVDEAHRALDPLEQLLTRMAALTGHLKTFARKSPGGLRERLDLALVVEQALQLLEPRLRAEHVQVDLQLARPAWVSGDAIRLEQVLINLLHNALDAMAGQATRRLRISTVRDANTWQLSVTDNGSGIAAADLDAIFDPFFTTKPVGEGLGLGLAVSRAIVEELHGQLLASNLPNGAVFTLSLPAAEAP